MFDKLKFLIIVINTFHKLVSTCISRLISTLREPSSISGRIWVCISVISYAPMLFAFIRLRIPTIAVFIVSTVFFISILSVTVITLLHVNTVENKTNDLGLGIFLPQLLLSNSGILQTVSIYNLYL